VRRAFLGHNNQEISQRGRAALQPAQPRLVNKPFNVGELMGRMRTALRHRMQRKAECVSACNFDPLTGVIGVQN